MRLVFGLKKMSNMGL
uniref:Uncharacterized protein n=1 Tax=Rhizophora mucronata TaxID=61149 RepID=A0A2P2ND54_RHIMU